MTELRREVRAWLQTSWDPDQPLGEWWRALAKSGWGYPEYPKEWGGLGAQADAARMIAEEIEAIGAYAPPWGIGTMMVAPLLLELGTEDQRRTWLPSILDGTEVWCQLFSEPDAGSDLANVGTTAVLDGDQWVVNGQKVWTSGAHHSNRAVLLARTDTEAPKHRGLSFFAIDMDQPGIETRPLVQMSGIADFNEVFLTDAVVPANNLIGEVNDGWSIALRLLSYERDSLDPEADAGIQTAMDLTLPAGDYVSGKADDGLKDFMPSDAEAWSILRRTLTETGAHTDPVVRQEAMRLYCMQQTSRFTALRSMQAQSNGKDAGPEGSLGKLASTHTMRVWRDLILSVLGPAGTLSETDHEDHHAIMQMCLSVSGLSIAGGTDEIQRNIVGEKLLGLPREPRAGT